jgi:2-oxoisovalerate dehydrogenase E1 component
MTAAVADPISGGRHKVFGHARLSIIPQTSTIGSHLPRAFGLALALGAKDGPEPAWPRDAVVVASFGDASTNHSTVVGALNAAGHAAYRGIDLPLLMVCEDNGIGISTRSPDGWVEAALRGRPGIDYAAADGADPSGTLIVARAVAEAVRSTRRPAILHLRTVRFGGHAGSDAEIGYRSHSEIIGDYGHDPLLATARMLVASRVLTPAAVRERYEAMRQAVMAEAETVGAELRLDTPEAVMAPLTETRPAEVRAAAARTPAAGARVLVAREAPEDQGPLTLAQSINSALADGLSTWPEASIFGQDVGRKGGVYGVTRGLSRRFGGRIQDTILDEQTILGTALGAAIAGKLPIPEIQYLAYLHNAEDQLRGEAATLRFFSDGQYANGMVVRIAGFAYQKGFGGHFHNDNSIAVLRDIPGLVVGVPSHPGDAPGMLRTCLALAACEGRVCVYVEPIARYHTRDLHEEGDNAWTAPYAAPDAWADDAVALGEGHTHLDGEDLLLVTFGNGLYMSLRAAAALEAAGVRCTVLDLRWLAPLPIDDLLEHARRFGHVLVVDETRATGGVSEGVLTALADHRYDGVARRVASRDSFVPLGPAANAVLLSEGEIVDAAHAVLAVPHGTAATASRRA